MLTRGKTGLGRPRLRSLRQSAGSAAYGTISGFATSAMFGFLPLFAEEDQLWSDTTAGALVAIVGLVGVVLEFSGPQSLSDASDTVRHSGFWH